MSLFESCQQLSHMAPATAVSKEGNGGGQVGYWGGGCCCFDALHVSAPSITVP